jgi:hypothetical protein
VRPGDEVVCDWRKWPDSPYRATPMSYLGEDDEGIWLYAPRGAAASYAADGVRPLPVSFLTLVPRGGQWWMATWMRDNPEIDIDVYVDIVQPPAWTDDGACLRIVDLDLDVIRRRSGEVLLDDEDEFEEHSVSLAYPSKVVQAARAAADAALAAVRSATPPFADAPDRWVRRATTG